MVFRVACGVAARNALPDSIEEQIADMHESDYAVLYDYIDMEHLLYYSC